MVHQYTKNGKMLSNLIIIIAFNISQSPPSSKYPFIPALPSSFNTAGAEGFSFVIFFTPKMSLFNRLIIFFSCMKMISQMQFLFRLYRWTFPSKVTCRTYNFWICETCQDETHVMDPRQKFSKFLMTVRSLVIWRRWEKVAYHAWTCSPINILHSGVGFELLLEFSS